MIAVNMRRKYEGGTVVEGLQARPGGSRVSELGRDPSGAGRGNPDLLKEKWSLTV